MISTTIPISEVVHSILRYERFWQMLAGFLPKDVQLSKMYLFQHTLM